MQKHIEYFSHVTNILNTVIKNEAENIESAVNAICEAIKNKQNIFAFGASHAGIITEELFYRAGGLALINPIFEPSMMLNVRPVTFTSTMERLPEYGKEIAKKTPIKKGDIIICHSVSGRNAVMIDFVEEAKNKGAFIIAVTNVSYSKSVLARHKNGKRLFEQADIVIDNHGDIGDASIEIEGLSQKVAPSSTIAGAAIVNSIVCAVAEQLVNMNIAPPIFHSANVDGGDEKNKKVFEEYKDNIFYM